MVPSATRQLDFVVAGAQKSGTTTIFNVLRRHEGLWLHPAKEAPFFQHDRTEAEVEHFMAEQYGGAPRDRLLGKVTPQYMADPGAIPRLVGFFPGVKVIVILREPVSRAYSQYRMVKDRGREHREFEAAVIDNLEHPGPARVVDGTEIPSYVYGSEYGRVLESWDGTLERDRLLVVFTADLERSPETVYGAIYDFLGVEPVHTGLEHHRFFVGDDQIARLSKASIDLARRGALGRISRRVPGHSAVSAALRKRADPFQRPPARTAPKAEPVPLGEATRQRLQAHFAEDARVLLEHVDRAELPW